MFDLTLIVPTLILFAGVIDDLYSKKVHNYLVLALIFLAVIYQFFAHGSQGLVDGLISAGLALAITLPMVLSRMLGAGDMKLMMAFGLSTMWPNVLWTIIYSFIWAALLGVLHALLNKKGKLLFMKTFSLVVTKGKDFESDFKIPYTIALAFGWLHHLVITNFSTGEVFWQM